MKNDAVKEGKSKVNGDTTKKDEPDSTSPEGTNAPHLTDNNDIKTQTASEYVVSNQEEAGHHDSRSGLNSTPTDEKPGDAVMKGNGGTDEAISVA